MKAMKMIGALCFGLSGMIYAMQPAEELLEHRLVQGNIDAQKYLSFIERSRGGHSPMITALRTADYRELGGIGYYGGLINSIQNAVRVDNGGSLRSLKFKMKRLIEHYYDLPQDALENGSVKLGKSS